MSNLSISPDQNDWTPEQRKMLGAVVHGGRLDEATSLQLLHFCQKTGLDIFTKQAYAIARGGKVQLQAGVDGLAAVAQRAAAARGLVIGNRPTKYYTADGKEMPFAPSNLHALTYTLTITDSKSGAVSEYNSTVLLSEYAQNNTMWKKMTAVMLEKVALSKAYRMAFPTDLSGVYSTEEVDLRDTKQDYTSKPKQVVGTATTAADEQDPFAVDGPDGRSTAQAKGELVAHIEGLGLSREAAIVVAKRAWDFTPPAFSTVSDTEMEKLKLNAEGFANEGEDNSVTKEVSE